MMKAFQLITALLVLTAAFTADSYAETFADSTADWSDTGTQGENNWIYGRYTQPDPGTAYDPDEFELFDETWWTGTGWDEPNVDGDNIPWTAIGNATHGPDWGHPNGPNSGGTTEWAIRRWIAQDLNEPMTLEFNSFLAAQNTGGTGTSALLLLNGTQIDAISTNAPLTANGSYPVTNSVYVDVNPDDVIDFALIADNRAGNVNDGADGSFFRLTVTDNPAPTPPFADSFNGWSADGIQGENGWVNGYYNRTISGNDYDPDEFIPFPQDWWTGTQWDEPNADGDNVPWTALGQETTHPNGDNNGDIHETIRRYEVSGIEDGTPLALNWRMSKANANGGGVGGILYVNGELVDSKVIAGTDAVGVDRTYYINANNGDIIDLALTPENIDGTFADGSDGSRNRLTIRTEIPDDARQPSISVVDSSTEFSGNQGENGWAYGFYDHGADLEFDPLLGQDGDGVFGNEPSDFTPFPEDWWTGTQWDEPNADGDNVPWTFMNATRAHPNDNDPGPDHHTVRRWESDGVEGEFLMHGSFFNLSANGDGTTGRIFLNGEEIYAELTDGVPVEFSQLVDIEDGDIIDILIDWGPGADGSDSTEYFFNLSLPGELFNPGNNNLVCDFDANGICDTVDIDELMVDATDGTNTSTYDLTGDGVVDEADRDAWLSAAGSENGLSDAYLLGDANLDGIVDANDLNEVGISWQDANERRWSNGNFVISQGEGVDANDLNVVGIAWQQSVAPAADASVVPEPSAGLLVLTAIMGLQLTRRRRRRR